MSVHSWTTHQTQPYTWWHLITYGGIVEYSLVHRKCSWKEQHNPGVKQGTSIPHDFQKKSTSHQFHAMVFQHEFLGLYSEIFRSPKNSRFITFNIICFMLSTVTKPPLNASNLHLFTWTSWIACINLQIKPWLNSTSTGWWPGHFVPAWFVLNHHEWLLWRQYVDPWWSFWGQKWWKKTSCGGFPLFLPLKLIHLNNTKYPWKDSLRCRAESRELFGQRIQLKLLLSLGALGFGDHVADH